MSDFADDGLLTGILDRLRSPASGSLLDRIDELRSRLLRCIVVATLGFLVSLGGAKYVLQFLALPLAQALPEHTNILHFTGPLEVFVAYLQVSFVLGAIVAAPFTIQQLWAWIVPALPAADRRLFWVFFLASISLFAGGIAFGLYLMLPVALSFLIELGEGVAVPTIMVEDYYALITFMLLGFGLVFQLPVVLIILERIGVIQEEHLQRSRRYVIVLIFLVAAILTPTPDPFSQCALALPMYIMFEAAVLIIRWRKRKNAQLPVPLA